MREFTFQPIGYIETCFKERFGTPRQPGLVPSSWAVLRLRPELSLADALEGISGFSHLWLVFVFHQNTNRRAKTKVHPPRLEGERVGLFATRTPHRPNPIGLSAVKLESVKGNELHLSGVDLLDGTPILDIKPYLPSSDCLPQASSGWTQDRPERTLEAEFSSQAQTDLERFFGDKAGRAKRVILETLSLDPRPVFYRGTAENPNPYMETYGFRLENFNVAYRMSDANLLVLSIEPWELYQQNLGKQNRNKSSPN